MTPNLVSSFCYTGHWKRFQYEYLIITITIEDINLVVSKQQKRRWPIFILANVVMVFFQFVLAERFRLLLKGIPNISILPKEVWNLVVFSRVWGLVFVGLGVFAGVVWEWNWNVQSNEKKQQDRRKVLAILVMVSSNVVAGGCTHLRTMQIRKLLDQNNISIPEEVWGQVFLAVAMLSFLVFYWPIFNIVAWKLTRHTKSDNA